MAKILTGEWKDFRDGAWQDSVNVSEFITRNFTEYKGDDSFLSGISNKTKEVWAKCEKLLAEETKNGGCLDVETNILSGINAFAPGYIDKDNEVIVGLQTDKPLKRIVNMYGGTKIAMKALESHGFKLNDEVYKHFTSYRKTHNDGVFDAYTPAIRRARSNGLLTGLPDGYGRGRIIGDYRRIALYGIDALIEYKKKDLNADLLNDTFFEEHIRQREEVNEQIRALEQIKAMAAGYGFDISRPAQNAREAIQWTYFGYLAGAKENNGAATSIGRNATFFDIYIQRDLENGMLTEEEAQELIDQYVIKLRLIRHLRTPDYDELFAGDPTWVTETIAGMINESKSLVTKSSFRLLNTLINLNPSAEPNLTVLWSKGLPENFKKYCAKISIKTDSIQYEGDETMRPHYGHDYAIACCVSAMKQGKQMQFFGARCNLAKALLYAINGGVDEKTLKLVIDKVEKNEEEVLTYEKVREAYSQILKNISKIYVDANNIIHYMHDKYAYEASQMALHDTQVERLMAFGVAGFSCAVDSLSAIKYAKVKPIRNEQGIAVDFEVEGEFPKFGNDDDRVDSLAVELAQEFFDDINAHTLYRNAKPTLSLLTITSNVMYGSKTGSTPDGRKVGEAFAPGANPMHGRDSSGALASLNSVAKIPYANCCQDGISNTFSIVPDALGKSESEQIDNLVSILDGYFVQGAQHINVNVFNRDLLIDAMNNPWKYPNLTIRVSGYAVNFNKLDRAHQEEVIARTFHEKR